MALYKILCTVPSTIIPRSPFDDHNLNNVESFESFSYTHLRAHET